MSKGYVYILSNPAMPGLIKIGRTSGSPGARAIALSQTGVPMPFKVDFSIWLPDCVDAERQAHSRFDKFRVSQAREFFTCKSSDVESFLEDYRQEIVEGFVQEFLPDSVLCCQYDFIDPSAIGIIGLLIGERPVDVPPILEEVRCDDVAFDIEELRRRWVNRKDKRSNTENNLSMVN